MSPQNQLIKIAEACGWKRGPTLIQSDLGECWISPTGLMAGAVRHGKLVGPPDYLNDLNAMHEAESILTNREAQGKYHDILCDLIHEQIKDRKYPPFTGFARSHATAAQRAEAFLRTLNLWEPTETD